jgi:tetratricopeptide (TPR) repeat protein
MDYLEESMWYFSKAKYKNALKRFDVIAGQYKNDLNALFYGGLSNYNLGRFEFALNNFESITRLEDTPFYEDSSTNVARFSQDDAVHYDTMDEVKYTYYDSDSA